MRIVLVYNANSGRGKGAQAAENVRRHLRKSGHDVASLELKPGVTIDQLTELAQSREAIIALGGDGTVSFAVGAAAATAVPIYHAPLGTENLFAREFQMRREAEAIEKALAGGRVRRIDRARCNGSPVLLVASFGPDAGVIHRLAEKRKGAISHRTYVTPVLGVLRDLPLTRHRVTVDGEDLSCEDPSIVIVANSSQYAGRLDPARDARMDDGLLDIAVLPYRSRARLIGWAGELRFARGMARRHMIYRRGKHVRVEAIDGPLVGQIDGEAMDGLAERSVEIVVEPDAVPVLVP